MNIRLTRNLKSDLYGYLTTKEVYEINDSSFDAFMKQGYAVVTEKPATVSFYKLASGGIKRQIKQIEKRISTQVVKAIALNKDSEKREDAKKRIAEHHQPEIDKLVVKLESLNEKATPKDEVVTVSEKKTDRAKRIMGKATKKTEN